MDVPSPAEQEIVKDKISELKNSILNSDVFTHADFLALVADMRAKISSGDHPTRAGERIVGDQDHYNMAVDAIEDELAPYFNESERIYEAWANQIAADGLPTKAAAIGKYLGENRAHDDHDKLSFIASIVARRYDAEFLEEEKDKNQAEKRWFFGLWPVHYSEYREKLGETDFDEDGFFESKTDELKGDWDNLNHGVSLKELFKGTHAVELLIDSATQVFSDPDKDLSPEDLGDIELELGKLKIMVEPGNTGIAETQVLYNRLLARYQKLRREWSSEVGPGYEDRAKSSLRSGELVKFNNYLDLLEELKDVLEDLSDGPDRIDSPANITAEQKEELLRLHGEVVASKQTARVALRKILKEDGFRLNELHVRLVNEAEVLLGIETDELESVFTDDVDWWLFANHGEQWRKTQRLWKQHMAENTLSLLSYDKMTIKSLIKYFSTEIQDLDEDDIAYHSRFIALDIQINRLQDMQLAIEEAETDAGDLEGVPQATSGRGFLEHHYHEKKPTHAEVTAWTTWHLKLFDHANSTLGEETAMRLIVEECNKHTLNFLQSYSASGYSNNAFAGLQKALQDFGKSPQRQEYSHDNFTKENRDFLRDKFLELSNVYMIEDIVQNHGDRDLFLVHPEELAKYEKTATGGTEDFSFDDTIDWLMHPEANGYKYAKITNWILKAMPVWIGQFERDDDGNRETFGLDSKDKWWNDREGRPWRKAFLKFVMSKVSEVMAQIPDGGTHTEQNVPIGLTGETMNVEFSQADFEGFDEDYQGVFETLIGRFATLVGVGLEVRMVTYCKGVTPSSTVQPYKSNFAGSSPFSHFNYKAYKNLTIVPTAEGYEIDWPNGSRVDEKKSKIVESTILTRTIVDTMAVGRPRINIGRLPTDKQLKAGELPVLKTAYPSLYKLCVVDYEERQKNPITLQIHWDGFGAYVSFTDAVMKPPGLSKENFSNPDQLEDILDKLTPEELREKMMEDLTHILKNLVSPLKINQDWFDYTFIAQDILIYIDKMFRLYRLKDTDPRGAAKLLVDVRSRLKSNATNLAIKNPTITNSRQPGEKIAFTETTHDIASEALGTGMYGDKEREDSDYDLRDFILNRLAFVYSGNWIVEKVASQFVQPSKVADAGEKIGGASISNSEKRVHSKSKRDLLQLIRSPKKLMAMKSLEIRKEDDLKPFMADSVYIVGMPSAEQQKAPEETK